jgi:hypothetical protein
VSKRASKSTIGPVEFIDRVIKRDEKGEPFPLTRYQRRVLEMALAPTLAKRGLLRTAAKDFKAGKLRTPPP